MAMSGEDRLIARHFRPLATHPGAFGLTDDVAALTPPPGCDLVLSCDAIVGGVHFFDDDPPQSIGQKALRVNLSDLAAKGAKPAGFLLTLVLPATTTDHWLDLFAQGLGLDAKAYDCPLLGGDTASTPGPLTISIAAFGTLPTGTLVRRSGGHNGDRLVVTGTIGDAALGLKLRRDAKAAERWNLDADQRDHLATRYLLPQPRNVLADALRRHATAAMDVSDGLAGDLAKLCAASGLGAVVTAAHVPLSDGARKAVAAEPELLETVLSGGDDYEVLAAVPATALAALHEEAHAAGVPLTEIGRLVAGSGETRFIGEDGHALTFRHASYSHF